MGSVPISAILTFFIDGYFRIFSWEETSVWMAISDCWAVLWRRAPAFCFLVVGDMLYMEVLLLVRLNLVLIGFKVP